MTPDQILPIAVVLTIGTAVQAAVGFGAGLVAIPLLVWLGVSLPVAVGLVLTLVIVQSGFNCWQNRDNLPWRPVVPVFLLRCLGLPAGIMMMHMVTGWQPSHAKQVIGLALMIAVALQFWWKVPPQPHVHWSWTALAGSSSGMMAGMVGMGGPPLVLWVMAHDWSTVRQRAFLWLTFMLQVPVQAVLMCLIFGRPIVVALLTGVALTPAGLAGAWLGGRIGRRLSRARLRFAMTLVLLGIAICSIASPWLTPSHIGPGAQTRTQPRAAHGTTDRQASKRFVFGVGVFNSLRVLAHAHAP